jgi:ATP-dependent DNA ligase
MPRVESRLMFLDAIPARGTHLYKLVCERDLEGIVAKWARGSYQCDGRATSWLKIKNPEYSQMQGRHELFDREHRRASRIRVKPVAPALTLR